MAINDDVWIGLNDISSEGVFEWINGDPYRNEVAWLPGQPSNSGGNENCVHINLVDTRREEMNDLPCNRNDINALCEIAIST